MLPLVLGVGSVSGFAAGYWYWSDPTPSSDDTTNLSVDTQFNTGITELKKLKDQSLHLKLKAELIKFDKKKLKKTNGNTNIARLTGEQQLMENMRQKILNRRLSIDPPAMSAMSAM